MLNILREKKNNPVIVVFLGAIIIVFILFFGTPTNFSGDRLFAAKVNDSTISDREYSARFSSAYRNYQAQFKEFNRDMAKSVKLREKVLDSMVLSRVLSEEAQRRGLAVDDLTLRNAVVENKNFQTEGRFDKTLYERLLNQSSLTPADFEASMREDLLASKYTHLAQSAVFVSSAEARQGFDSEERSINLEFARVPIKAFEGQVTAVTDADASEWLQSEGASEKIEKHYGKFRRTRYDIPKKVRARHVLARVEKDAPPDVRRAAKDRIVEAIKAVEAGMDFAAAAKKYSDDSTKERGGDLGFFSEGQMVRPFEEAAFALKPQELSGIVESPFGFHMIKVEEIKEPVQRKLEDVKMEIAKELAVSGKAEELAKARAARLLASAKGGKALKEAAEEDKTLPFSVEETGAFNRGRDYLPKLGVNKELSVAAWNLKQPGDFGELIEVDGSLVVFRLKERHEPSAKDWEAKRVESTQRMTFEKAAGTVEEWSKSIRDRAKVEIHPLTLDYDDSARNEARSKSQGRN